MMFLLHAIVGLVVVSVVVPSAADATTCIVSDQACLGEQGGEIEAKMEADVEEEESVEVKAAQVQLLQTGLSLETMGDDTRQKVLFETLFPCDQCVAKGFEADTCGCGTCGSYGFCSWSCTHQSATRPGCLVTDDDVSAESVAEFHCDECVAKGFKPDVCGCGVCGSWGGCSWSCTHPSAVQKKCSLVTDDAVNVTDNAVTTTSLQSTDDDTTTSPQSTDDDTTTTTQSTDDDVSAQSVCPDCDPVPECPVTGVKCQSLGKSQVELFDTLCECQCRAEERGRPLFVYNADTKECVTRKLCNTPVKGDGWKVYSFGAGTCPCYPWDQYGPTHKKCHPDGTATTTHKNMCDCQDEAKNRGHLFFSYIKKTNECVTAASCDTFYDGQGWKIFSSGVQSF